MLPSLRTILPISLSGVLAVIGLWWYTSRKKAGIADDDPQEEETAERASESDRDSRQVQKGSMVESDGDGQRVQKASMLEEDVFASFKECVAADRDTCTGTSSTASYESAPDLFQGTAAETVAQGEPGTAEALLKKNQLSSNEDSVSVHELVSQISHVLGESAEVKPQSPARSQSPDVPSVTLTELHVEGERLEPEGEERGHAEVDMALCFSEHPPPSDLSENGVLSKENHPVLSSAVAPVCGSGLMDSRSPPGSPSLSYSNAKEMQQLAESLISDMVSAAVAEVLRGRTGEKTFPEQRESPLCTREPCAVAAPDCIPGDNAEMHRDSPRWETQEVESLTANTENSTSSTLQEDDNGHETLQTGMCPEEVYSHFVEHDSASSSTSSTQSDDGSSDEDYKVLPRPGAELPEDSEDLDEDLDGRSGTTKEQPEVLSNGHSMKENQLAQGREVTSITSADSGYSSNRPSLSSQEPAQSTEGLIPSQITEPQTTQPQTSQPQTSQSQTTQSQTTQPQTIWEIEVPKHLVGRVIGKQGRYVSYLEASSGAKVCISTVPYTQEVQICHIEGTEDQVEIVLDLLRIKFKDLELTNCYVTQPPPARSLPALPLTSWLLMPHGVTVEVKVVLVTSGNYLFLQQHTHPSFPALRVLDQQMSLCYALPGCPGLPAPAEVGVICAAQLPEGVWWRAQVMRYNEESSEADIRYVDYGGYHTVNINNLRQIRSDFVSLPFQGSEVILENIAPISGEDGFSAAAKSALEELTQGVSLLAQVTEFHTSGIPLVQIWRKEENGLVSVNQALVERGVCSWINRP